MEMDDSGERRAAGRRQRLAGEARCLDISGGIGVEHRALKQSVEIRGDGEDAVTEVARQAQYGLVLIELRCGWYRQRSTRGTRHRAGVGHTAADRSEHFLVALFIISERLRGVEWFTKIARDCVDQLLKGGELWRADAGTTQEDDIAREHGVD
ncbi:hypothetical protein PX554_26090 [Sphingomonas sp. H39-1-10]|uniref:hypothetical protein n=1 Tax=Sphingomonas pollutisoli TaxID=3030829 RepID=UPI0023B9A349|nr:hypothetical protein [Sphingomonas pollutisoli]MDF0491589.1 hypothetical protein [Sphingomonas pollutisoli]